MVAVEVRQGTQSADDAPNWHLSTAAPKARKKREKRERKERKKRERRESACRRSFARSYRKGSKQVRNSVFRTQLEDPAELLSSQKKKLKNN